MTVQEIENKRNELQKKISEAKDLKEVEVLMRDVESFNKEVEESKESEEEKEETTKVKTEDKKEGKESEKEQEISRTEERSLIRDTQNLENKSINVEVRGMDEKELKEIEKRGIDLKNGDEIQVRSVTVSSDKLLVPKKYSNSITEAFQSVSGVIGRVHTLPLNGGESYSVPFEKSKGEGDYTDEGGNYTDVDLDTDYVETGRAKITAYSEITEEAIKLPNVDYASLVERNVRTAILKKLGAQLIVGQGGANQIKGIYNADTKILPTSTGTADIELSEIDADTLNTLVFSYGGDESIEDEAEIVLTKKDVEAFAKVKTTDGKFVYNVTRNGQRGTIGYKDGGLSIPYTINSACNSLSSSSTTVGTYTMVYGSFSDYELPMFSNLVIKKSEDYKFKQGMTAYKGSVIVGGTVKRYRGFVRVKKAQASI